MGCICSMSVLWIERSKIAPSDATNIPNIIS
jgi:hypothetical protein